MGTRLLWHYGVMQVFIKIKIVEICCFTGLFPGKILYNFQIM